MEKKKLQEEERMYRKEKSHIVKAMDQPLSKLVQRLKELRTVSETSGTTLNAPTFEL